MLVHCMAGVSRSSSIIIHHTMMNGLNLRDAVMMVKTARPVVQPNKAFVKTLVAAELKERGENSIGEEEMAGGEGMRGRHREDDVQSLMDSFGERDGRCLIF